MGPANDDFHSMTDIQVAEPEVNKQQYISPTIEDCTTNGIAKVKQ